MDDDYAEFNDFFDNDALEDDEATRGKGSSDQVNELLEKENEQAKKKATKTRFIPKLNEETLMGPKGIQALRHSFKSFKPDPNKDPYDNLDVMLRKYEHWAHCMFPKLKFDDIVNRCEQLGEKKAIKVYMTKSRLDMPLTDEDFASTRRGKRDEIIETENNEDDVTGVRRRSDSDNDENYYDPLQSAPSRGKHGEREAFALSSTLSMTINPEANFSSDVLDDMLESANEARRIAIEDERKRKEEEALAMADEIMADFDMY
ncbi:hypothetical protein KIN20_001072 [Parelaphostrongylus tenuis]|uniref:TIMELESS-interacting protein n=1 Tax=Parelaphostrongylus tenuis TaxID=148309 RepID=A0AAD5QE91_PARTN|nr:hypothetical protein KIN20_001072 [Parelaphostrongylus tenuis]